MKAVQTYSLDYKAGDKYQAILMSDLHWDNPKCDRELLRRDLDRACEAGLDIFIFGDLFCAMQGRYDGRRMKADVRPEHNTNTYLDALVDTAVDWFTPYAQNIKLIGYGNHETAILKNCETDLLARLVHGLNVRGATVELGGYGGWIVWSFKMDSGNGMSFRAKYFHGAGGGGPVTKGVIQNQRAMASIQGADLYVSGHVHESYTMYHVVETLNNKHNPELKEVLHVRTPTYKEEYGDGTKGWHIMRGAPPKPLGCYLLELNLLSRKVKATARPW